MSKKLAIRFLGATTIWFAIAALHLFSGYLDAIKYSGHYIFNGAEATYYTLAYHSWAIFSILYLIVIEKYLSQKNLIIAALTWTMLAPIWLSIFFSIDALLNIQLLSPENTTWLSLLKNTPNATIFFYFILYCVASSVCFAIFYYRSSQQALLDALTLEKQNTKSQLELTNMKLEQLQSQLSPHFLFNCLGSISALARNGDREALISAIAQVGNLLRFCVSTSAERFIFFSQELDFVNDYLALQILRYPDKFELDKALDKKALSVQCPPFLLHTIVENVFSHGVDNTQEKVRIRLMAEINGGTLKIIVNNTKPSQASQNAGLNYALKNLKTRLQLTYPENHQLHVDESHSLFTVTICIPTVSGGNEYE